MKNIILIASLTLVTSALSAQTSPNGHVRVQYNDDSFVVSYLHDKQWQTIMTMPMQLKQTRPIRNTKQKVDYQMLTGKRLHCTNAYTQSVYALADGHELRVRAYNDGVTWRSTCQSNTEQEANRDMRVDFSASQSNWIMTWSDSYEGFFPQERVQKEGEHYGYPALFEYPNGVYALLTESNVDSISAASSFYATVQPDVFSIRTDGPEPMGDRTLIIGTLNDIVESTLVTDNSQPCRLEDTSWIQPGVASWVYWAYNHGSKDYDIIKKYTDMAVQMKLPYVLIDAEWDEAGNVFYNGDSVQMIRAAVDYANANGVKPMIWYNSSIGWINGAPGPKFRLNKPEDREKEFAWCERIGVKGVKIDFFSGDNNRNIRYMIELLESAARHHLLVNFHGATIPRGLQRTYPNLISTEGVYGAEWYNNVPTFTNRAARHNAMLPFTRNVVGSMDYTPCAWTDSQHPHITSHAHELALTVLYESGIQHLADRPESFLSQPDYVRGFISELPTAWDETRLISGYPGKSVVMARRKGDRWYVAGINGTDQSLSLDIQAVKSVLKDRSVRCFYDKTEDDSNPWSVINTVGSVLPTAIPCKARGGFVIVVL